MIVALAALGIIALVMRPGTPFVSGFPSAASGNATPTSQQRVPTPTTPKQPMASPARQVGSRPAGQKPDPPTEETAEQHVRIVNIAHSVVAGNDVTVIAQAKPDTTCTVVYFTPSGHPSSAAGLAAKLTSTAGTVTWTWRIGSGTSAGTAKVRVTCGPESVEENLVVLRTTPASARHDELE